MVAFFDGDRQTPFPVDLHIALWQTRPPPGRTSGASARMIGKMRLARLSVTACIFGIIAANPAIAQAPQAVPGYAAVANRFEDVAPTEPLRIIAEVSILPDAISALGRENATQRL
jgi:hypothetical protein